MGTETSTVALFYQLYVRCGRMAHSECLLYLGDTATEGPKTAETKRNIICDLRNPLISERNKQNLRKTSAIGCSEEPLVTPNHSVKH